MQIVNLKIRSLRFFIHQTLMTYKYPGYAIANLLLKIYISISTPTKCAVVKIPSAQAKQDCK